MKFLNILILGFILSINARAYHSHHSHSHHSHSHPHIGHNHIHSNDIRENVENEDLSDTKKIVLIITFALCLALIFSPVEKKPKKNIFILFS